jgi:hypothetical protein
MFNLSSVEKAHLNVQKTLTIICLQVKKKF